MAPLTSTMMTGGLPSGVCMAPKLITSSSATVVAAGERSPSWMAASSAVSSAGATAGANHDAAVEEEAASSLLLLRRRTAVDADVDVGVEDRADTAATTLAWSSADQLPTSAASSSLPSDARTSATLVAEEAIDETGVDAMSSNRRKRAQRRQGSEKPTEPTHYGPSDTCSSSHARMCYTTTRIRTDDVYGDFCARFLRLSVASCKPQGMTIEVSS